MLTEDNQSVRAFEQAGTIRHVHVMRLTSTFRELQSTLGLIFRSQRMVTFVIDSVNVRMNVSERVDLVLHLKHPGEIFLNISQLSVAEVARVILHITRRSY